MADKGKGGQDLEWNVSWSHFEDVISVPTGLWESNYRSCDLKTEDLKPLFLESLQGDM